MLQSVFVKDYIKNFRARSVKAATPASADPQPRLCSSRAVVQIESCLSDFAVQRPKVAIPVRRVQVNTFARE